MTVCDGPVCICGLSDDRCVCGCVVPEAAPIADFLPSAAKAAAMAVELPPPPAEPTVGPPVKRTAFSSRYELQRGELREIDSEAQLEAVAAEEIAMQRKRKRWKPPAPEDLAEEELEVVGAICEMELLGQLVQMVSRADDGSVADFVREHRIDPNTQDIATGHTPLRAAACAGRAIAVAELIDCGAELWDVDCHGRCALWWSCALGRDHVLSLLLDYDPAAAPPPDDSGASCAGLLLRRGHDGALCVLLDRAASADQPGSTAACGLLRQIGEADIADASANGHAEALHALRRHLCGSWLAGAAAGGDLAAATSAPLLESRVVLRGMRGRPELNGRTGVAVGWDDVTGRYTVALDAGAAAPAKAACDASARFGGDGSGGDVSIAERHVHAEAEGAEEASLAAGSGESDEPDGAIGELARGALLFRDDLGRPRCDEFGNDPYGRPIWNAIPTWLVEEAQAARQPAPAAPAAAAPAVADAAPAEAAPGRKSERRG